MPPMWSECAWVRATASRRRRRRDQRNGATTCSPTSQRFLRRSCGGEFGVGGHAGGAAGVDEEGVAVGGDDEEGVALAYVEGGDFEGVGVDEGW